MANPAQIRERLLADWWFTDGQQTTPRMRSTGNGFRVQLLRRNQVLLGRSGFGWSRRFRTFLLMCSLGHFYTGGEAAQDSMQNMT